MNKTSSSETPGSYEPTAIDDFAILDRLPNDIAASLSSRNGYIEHDGGFHVRGACTAPLWHSLRFAWEGPSALHRLFPAVRETDIPLAEDCFGDQCLLRDGLVVRLSGETGEVENLPLTWIEFLKQIEIDPIRFLSLQPLIRFRTEGGDLQPGESLSVYPPFIAKSDDISLRAVPTVERISFLADLAQQIKHVADGERIRIVVEKKEN
jgi:hypothetical protein